MTDSLLAAIADRTRRRILERLEPLDPGVTVAAADLPTAEGSDASLTLRHVHLPKLDDAGLVDWDRETGRVGRGETFERVVPLLRAAREVERDPSDRRPTSV